MKTLIFNDTSKQQHLGCRLTKQALSKIYPDADFVPYDETEKHIDRIPDYNKIIVNGEGTMHHSQTRAIWLMQVLLVAQKYGIYNALINSVWDSMSYQYLNSGGFPGNLNRSLPDILNHADRVQVRDSLSWKAMYDQGVRGHVVKDDLIFERHPKDNKYEGTVTIFDTILIPVHPSLREDYPTDTLADRVEGQTGESVYIYDIWGSDEPYEKVIHRMGRARRVISGSWHGCLMGYMAYKPVYPLPANSHKNLSLILCRDYLYKKEYEIYQDPRGFDYGRLV